MNLSDPSLRISRVYHPWRQLRENLSDWTVCIEPLHDGLLGATHAPTRTIYLNARQHQAQRRCTLDHELEHARAGDVGCQHPKREAQIDQASARRLVALAQLVEAAKWAHSIDELADECWVDVATMRCRLDHLHPSERAAVRRAIAERDYHEEGMP